MVNLAAALFTGLLGQRLPKTRMCSYRTVVRGPIIDWSQLHTRSWILIVQSDFAGSGQGDDVRRSCTGVPDAGGSDRKGSTGSNENRLG